MNIIGISRAKQAVKDLFASQSRKAFLKLFSGVICSQAVIYALTPVITRVYTPQSFGIFAAFSSVLTLCASLSSFRYELAIPMPKDDIEAGLLVRLCILLSISFAIVLTILILVFPGIIVNGLGQPQLKPYLWLLPLSIFASSLYQILSYSTIRLQRFGLLARIKVTQSMYGIIINIFSSSLGPIGLMLGQFVNQVSGTIDILIKLPNNISVKFCRSHLRDLYTLFIKYKRFGLYSSPAGLINMFGNQYPILFFASSFGSLELGYFALAQKIVSIPITLITSSISQVFLGKSTSYRETNSLSIAVKSLAIKLFAFSLVLSLFILWIIPPIIPALFGRDWVQTGNIIRLLVPSLIGEVTVSPLSMAYIMSNNNKGELFSQILQNICKISPLLLAKLFNITFLDTVLIYSLGSLLGYGLYGYYMFRSIGKFNISD